MIFNDNAFLARNHGVATPESRVREPTWRPVAGRGPSMAGCGRDRPPMVGRSWPLGAALLGRLHRCLVARFGGPFPVAARFWPPMTPCLICAQPLIGPPRAVAQLLEPQRTFHWPRLFDRPPVAPCRVYRFVPFGSQGWAAVTRFLSLTLQGGDRRTFGHKGLSRSSRPRGPAARCHVVSEPDVARGRVRGRDESVRRRAGSQWIVAARPLCHLQCPVAF